MKIDKLGLIHCLAHCHHFLFTKSANEVYVTWNNDDQHLHEQIKQIKCKGVDDAIFQQNSAFGLLVSAFFCYPDEPQKAIIIATTKPEILSASNEDAEALIKLLVTKDSCVDPLMRNAKALAIIFSASNHLTDELANKLLQPVINGKPWLITQDVLTGIIEPSVSAVA